MEKEFNDSRLASLHLLTHKLDFFLEHKALVLGLDPGFETTFVLQLSENATKHVPNIFCLVLNLQSELLRVLEDQTFRRVGGVKDIRTNVRVVCASN